MSNQIFLIVPTEAKGAAAQWWSAGGAELMDELDPECKSETGTPLGPFEGNEGADQVGDWWDRARKIPGWAQTGIRIIGRLGGFADFELASSTHDSAVVRLANGVVKS